MSRTLLLVSSLFQENKNTSRLFCEIFTGFPYIIESCLKFYSSSTRLLTILHHHTFAIYSHLTSLLVNYVHHLKNLVIPHLKTYGVRSFSVAAPTLWITLPSNIINNSSVSIFKNRLKTFLFKRRFYNFTILLLLLSAFGL